MPRIHVYDTDPRQHTDPSYLSNMGSFSIVARGFNKGLKELGYYAEPDDAAYVGICDGLNFNFSYKESSSFLIHVWDCINVLPQEIISQKIRNKHLALLGLSNQVTNLWQEAGFECRTVMPGCDVDFWHPTVPKNDVFTFFFNSFANIRSGLDLAVEAFCQEFYPDENVQLVIQNTSNSIILKNKLETLAKKHKIKFNLGERISFENMRDLYSSSHVSLNVMRHSSWGLNIHEAMACGCVPIVGDFCPSNEIIKGTTDFFIKPIREIYIDTLAKNNTFDLHNAYGNFSYVTHPRIYNYSIEEYGAKMRNIYKRWDYFSQLDPRSYVCENWSWKQAALNLKKTLCDYSPE